MFQNISILYNMPVDLILDSIECRWRKVIILKILVIICFFKYRFHLKKIIKNID